MGDVHAKHPRCSFPRSSSAASANILMQALDFFWAFSPIQDAITSHLTRQDLVHCTLASKSLLAFAAPTLWKVATFPTVITLQDFIRNTNVSFLRHYVKTLRIQAQFVSTWHDFFDDATISLSCPNVVSLVLSMPVSSEESTMHLFSFLETHTQLRSLSAAELPSSAKYLEQLCSIVNGHPSLESLDLSFGGLIHEETLVTLLQSCYQLSKLRIVGGLKYKPSNALEPLTGVTLTDSFALQDLTIAMYSARSNLIFLRLLQLCPKLAQLTWTRSSLSEEEAALLLWTLKEYCPVLNSVALRPSDNVASVVLGLEKLRGLKMALRHTDPGLGMAALMHHAPTLQALDLLLGVPLLFKDLCLIAKSCPRLESLTTKVKWIPPAPGHHLDRETREPWTGLTRLKEIHLILEHAGSEDMFCGILYECLGAVTGLESLTLSCMPTGPVLAEAYSIEIQTLHRLKRLKRFELKNVLVRIWTVTEMERMLERWPRLESFTISRLPECLKEGTPARKLLQEKRPWLKVRG